MTPTARELVSSTSAIAAVGGAAVAGLHLGVCVAAGGLVYAGLRLFLPAERAPSITDARTKQFDISKDAVAKLHENVELILDDDFRHHATNLVSTLDLLITRTEEDSDETTIDQQFPMRINLLTDILKKYNDVTRVPKRTASVVSAIEHTHEIFEKASNRFSDLIAQQIDEDAVELKVDARVYDELQSINFD